MKCIQCGRYPFCNKIQNSQQEACEKFIKRKLMITTDSPLTQNETNTQRWESIKENIWRKQKFTNRRE